MTPLTDSERKLLARYLKLVSKEERYIVFKQARLASNALLDSVEVHYKAKVEPTDADLTWLQGINRRRSKNYRRLVGVDKLIRFTRALKERTLSALGGS